MFNESEPTAEVYTYNGKLKRKLGQMSLEFPAEVKLIKTCPTGAVTYELPKSLLSIRKPVSEEQKQAARDRALASNFGQKT